MKNMKNMNKLAILASVAVASTVVMQQAQANSITGFVAMSGGITLNSDSLASATSGTFETVPTPDVTGGDGSYLGTVGATVTWTGSTLTFGSGSESITPLWTFSSGGETFSFNLSTITGYSVTGGDTVADLTGTGTLTGTGGTTYTPTAGTFSLSIDDVTGGASGQASFGFASSDSAVPDGGLTVALLGGSLIALQAFRRKIQS
jgi:hypothetical protein